MSGILLIRVIWDTNVRPSVEGLTSTPRGTIHDLDVESFKKNSALLTLYDYKYDKKEHIQKKEFFKL